MPPQGGIGIPKIVQSFIQLFQVMPPQGGIFSFFGDKIISVTSFKSCPRKGASSSIDGNVSSIYVSSHAPARGHQRSLYRNCVFYWFQVMPPQGGITKNADTTAKQQ